MPPPSVGGEYYKDEGVLHSDTYTLYPWDESSINIGFSKYGEMINGDDDVGLEYKGIDAFAGSVVPEKFWNNGWVIDIHWIDQGVLKNVWAYALYTDWSGTAGGIAGPWRQMQKSVDASATGDVTGGRRTSGWAETDDIKLIYDGPRKAIYLLKTTIYDKDPQDPEAQDLVEITIQLVFEKVKKYVMEIKDIKRLADEKILGPLQIEFSQRAEWDLGSSSINNAKTYAEFYDDLKTEYTKHPFYCDDTGYDLVQMLNRESKLVGYAAYWPSLISKWVTGTDKVPRVSEFGKRIGKLTSLETFNHKVVIPTSDKWPLDMYVRLIPNDSTGLLHIFLPYDPVSYPRGECEWSNEPWVFVKNSQGQWVELLEYATWEFVEITDPTLPHPYGTSDWAVKLLVPPLEAIGNEYLILFKQYAKGAKEHTELTPLPCMPECTFNTWPGSKNPSFGMDVEPAVPYVMAEWDFELTNDNLDASTHQFRCVSLYGVTDLNNAVDPDEPVGAPKKEYRIDSEVLYQLNEVFNPYDLNDAVHDSTARWAQKGDLPAAGSPQVIELTSHKYTKYGELCESSHTLVYPDKWGYYCTSSEKVILFDADGVKKPLLLKRPGQYVINGWMVTLDTSKIPDYSKYDFYKVLYSTKPYEQDPMTGRFEWIVAGETSHASDTTGAAMVTAAFQEWKSVEVWLSGLDVQAAVYAPGIPWVMRSFGDPAVRDDYYYAADDKRVAFRDDWCTPEDWDQEDLIHPYAVSSADILSIGGPINNLAGWYLNDFTDALVFTEYGTGFYAPGCWARTTQHSLHALKLRGTPMDELAEDELWYNDATPGNRYGYAIVSAYKDINGTGAFTVYGYTAEDTYYACYAIRGGLLAWMQSLQPGATTLVIEIDYDTLHPVAFHVKESLGVFTECTGFDTSFKTGDYADNLKKAEDHVKEEAKRTRICYKIVDVDWCAQVHPDP